MLKRIGFTSILAAVLMVAVACTVDQVLADINLAVQAAGSIGLAVGAVSPADASIIAGLSALATKALTVIQQDYDAAKASGAQSDLDKLAADVSAIQANLPAALSAAHIENSAAQQKVTAWVNLTVASVNAVNAYVKQVTPATTKNQKATLLRTAAADPNLSPDTFEARWSKDVCGGEKKCSGMVRQHKGVLHAIRQGTAAPFHALGDAIGEAKFGG